MRADTPPAVAESAGSTAAAQSWADAVATAVQRSQAVIEFDLDGIVQAANDNFLSAMGYGLSEVVGQHHRVFVQPEEADSEAYAAFWERLRAGEFIQGEFLRRAKGKRLVWLQATYNPVLGPDGRPTRIVKIASDTTQARLIHSDNQSKIAAVDRTQILIEFDLDGRILDANRNFLDATGYTLPEVVGKHHRMLCPRRFVESPDYTEMWERLRAGEFMAGEHKRVAKDGSEIWLQATYNAVLGLEGKPIKIVKFASDITATKTASAENVGKVSAIDRSQAVIEFDLTGTILWANRNFLETMGYALSEIEGKHHRMFCDQDYTATTAYTDFWQRLGRGEFEAGEYKRLTRNGREVWLQATYNPIMDSDGRPVKIVKFAQDVTANKLAAVELAGIVQAVDRAQAVIEFDLEGNVLAANENFLRTMGYSLKEAVGQHHSVFCSEDYQRSAEYRDFWLRLAKGELISGRFHRIGKYGRDVHIQATYSPILDAAGRPYKVIKYAYDVTPAVRLEQQIAGTTTEVTAAVRNLSGAIGEINRSSDVAITLAGETHSNAEQGVEALRASLEAITLIQRSSQSISEIVRVMGDIANQTNLLAFNASIEAARAGEHGVGFSIVAGEVRKLAERSSAAAQEIGELIKESAERVEQGSSVSKRAENAFERIATGVSRTNEAIRAISEAARLQQLASQKVDSLVNELSQHNADR